MSSNLGRVFIVQDVGRSAEVEAESSKCQDHSSLKLERKRSGCLSAFR